MTRVVIKSNDHEVLKTKTDLVFNADIRQALHKSGSWYLIPTQFCIQHADSRLPSLVFHICGKSWLTKSNPDDAGVERRNVTPFTEYRQSLDSMKTECCHCGSEVPTASSRCSPSTTGTPSRNTPFHRIPQ